MIAKPATQSSKLCVLAAVTVFFGVALLGCSDETNSQSETDMAVNESDMSGDSDDSGASEDTDSTTLLDLPVAEPGPYNAGYRTVVHEYEVTPGQMREITVNLWYPTEATDGELSTYLDLFRDPDSFRDAELAPSPWPDGNFPVHVYSHGDQGFGGTAAQLMRHFASHGWVSVAPDHTGNTLTNNLDPRPPALRAWRSLDISATLDAAARIDGELEDKLNTDEVFLSGHSFGGFTVWATAGSTFDPDAVREECQLDTTPVCTPEEVQLFADGVADSRAVAALTIAGNYREAWFGTDGFSTVEIPIIALSGTQDPRGHAEEFELIEGVDLTWIDVEGACHESFTLGAGCATIDADAAFEVVDTYGLAAARRYVLEDNSQEILDLLNGEKLANETVVTFRQK